MQLKLVVSVDCSTHPEYYKHQYNEKTESMLVSVSLLYWFFTTFILIPSKQCNKACYDGICVQGCPNFNIWG